MKPGETQFKPHLGVTRMPQHGWRVISRCGKIEWTRTAISVNGVFDRNGSTEVVVATLSLGG
jgi:hypothetical protein